MSSYKGTGTMGTGSVFPDELDDVEFLKMVEDCAGKYNNLITANEDIIRLLKIIDELKED